jgi:hypothetical protein
MRTTGVIRVKFGQGVEIFANTSNFSKICKYFQLLNFKSIQKNSFFNFKIKINLNFSGILKVLKIFPPCCE